MNVLSGADRLLRENEGMSSVRDGGLGPATQPLVRHVAIALAKLDGISWAQAKPTVRAESMRKARSLLQEERAFLSAHIASTDGEEETFESSIWFRALHKSASMFVFKFSRFVISQLPHRWEFFSTNNKPANLKDAINAKDSFIAIARSFEPAQEEFISRRPRVIFHLRDPRDILVSEYFSLGFIHGDQNFASAAKDMREKIQSGSFTIDDYVIHSAREGSGFFGQSGLCERMTDHLAAGIAQCDEHRLPYLVVRYEDMVLDFPRWATSVLNFMQLSSLRDVAIDRFQKEFDIKAVEERGQLMQHKRAIIPGDYRTKLRPDTIAELNRLFDPILSKYYN